MFRMFICLTDYAQDREDLWEDSRDYKSPQQQAQDMIHAKLKGKWLDVVFPHVAGMNNQDRTLNKYEYGGG